MSGFSNLTGLGDTRLSFSGDPLPSCFMNYMNCDFVAISIYINISIYQYININHGLSGSTVQRHVYDGLQENISLLWVLELGSYLSATSRKTTTGIVDILNILN